MRPGCQWQAIPRPEYAPGSTGQGRFSQWVKDGVWVRAGKVRLEYYDQQQGIAWKWQALEGVITKAPWGGEGTGPSPVDRGKGGANRSLLTDQRGAPLSVVVTGANTHDKPVALETFDGIIVPRPAKIVDRLHLLCLDQGDDDDDVIAGVLERDYHLHLKNRGQADPEGPADQQYPARRWVVERTHAWHNKFRRLVVRWERKLKHYEAMIHLAGVLILYRLVATA